MYLDIIPEVVGVGCPLGAPLGRLMGSFSIVYRDRDGLAQFPGDWESARDLQREGRHLAHCIVGGHEYAPITGWFRGLFNPLTQCVVGPRWEGPRWTKCSCGKQEIDEHPSKVVANHACRACVEKAREEAFSCPSCGKDEEEGLVLPQGSWDYAICWACGWVSPGYPGNENGNLRYVNLRPWGMAGDWRVVKM